MKRIVLFAIALCIGFMGMAQQKTVVSKELLKQSILQKVVTPSDPVMTTNTSYAPVKEFKSVVMLGTETEIIDTKYDLQSNTLLSNRIYAWPDGTISAVATMGLETPPGSPDRGTGYNHYDGSEWQPKPTERLEDNRTGWPSIAPWGETGEVTCSHLSENAISVLTREVKGVGAWTATTIAGPDGGPGLLWPRVTTSGENNEYIHIFALTTPSGNGGAPWLGQDGALLYYRSTDGAQTWDIKDVVLEGMGDDSYVSISADDYVLASRGNTVTLLVASMWYDMFMMKSDDNGMTWEKTVIWQHPYPMFDIQTQFLEDTLYAVGNSAQVALDAYGNAHVVYATSRIMRDNTMDPGFYSFFPYYDGVGYWNESMEAPIPTPDEVPGWANYPDYYTLNPDYLFEDGVLIGWSQDVNGNGTLDFVEVASGEFPFAIYRSKGLSTMTTLTVTDDDVIAVAFSSPTETYATSDERYNYYHTWVVTSPDLGSTWDTENFTDLQAGELFHIFDECIYGQFAPNNSMDSDHFDFMYNADEKPGVFLDEDDQLEPTTNRMIHNRIAKDDVVGVKEINTEVSRSLKVSDCYPNPTRGITTLTIRVENASTVSVEVFNLTGQKVLEVPTSNMTKGVNSITFDASSLNSGVYFYTVTAGSESISKKMIVE